MASSTKNVKLGVCNLFLAGQDLGYTQGGVEVTVTTETHQVEVDQFGKTPINEYIMGRTLKVKASLAETTLENAALTMPGAKLSFVGGTPATGTVTFSGVPVANDSVTLNGVTFTFKASPASVYELAIPASANAAASALAAAASSVADPALASASYVANAGVVTITYGNPAIYGTTGKPSVDGNAYTLAKTGTSATVSGATLTGGVDPTSAMLSSDTGVGTDLLSVAKELRLHPKGKAANDLSDDFIVLRAASAGSLNFAYKLENERVFAAEFTGYPRDDGKLFSIGGRLA